MPVYKDETKKKNKYWYEFEAGKDALGNRQKIRKKGFFSGNEAKAAMISAMDEFNKGEYLVPSKLLFKDYLVDTWLEARKRNLSSQTMKMYKSYINTHVVPSELGKKGMEDLSGELIQKFINQLEAKSLADSTVRKIYNIINTSLKDAVIIKLIKYNMATLIIGKPKVSKKEIKVWNVEEVKTFIKEGSDKSRYYIAFYIALMTGMRQGEILGLRWKDVDLGVGIIRVTQTLEHDGKSFKAGAKSISGIRPIAIDTDTIEILKIYKEKFEETKRGLDEKFNKNDLVICTQLGTTVSPRNLLRAFTASLENIKVPKISMHDLRHTHATMLLEQGVNPKIVSERLGHASVKITLDLYSHLLPNMQEEAADKLRLLLN